MCSYTCEMGAGSHLKKMNETLGFLILRSQKRSQRLLRSVCIRVRAMRNPAEISEAAKVCKGGDAKPSRISSYEYSCRKNSCRKFLSGYRTHS
jgi:hypothetical protein